MFYLIKQGFENILKNKLMFFASVLIVATTMITLSMFVIIGENVKSLGNPHSIRNVVSKGQVNCYSYVTLDTNKSKVDFEVIVHSAKIAGGSSGGALLNSDNEIIGITFAGVFDNTGNFITGYAIPAMRIKEFLNR